MVILLLAVVIVVAVASRNPAGKRVYSYHESASNDTNDPGCFFLVGDFQSGIHIGPCGIGQAVNWSYHIFLSGAGDRFPFERVDVEPDAFYGRVRPISGEVLLDRTKNQVTISLRVAHGTNMEDFVGNGTFTINKTP
jgi:hypothetical protein